MKRCRNIKTFERAILAPRLCCEVTDYANSPQPLVSLFRDSGAVTIDSGIIVAVGHSRHEHDKKTLDSDIEQITKLRNFCPDVVICDRGYRGRSMVGDTSILIPKPSGKKVSAYQWQKMRKRFRSRAGIEPIIGHLKHDHRLICNFLKVNIGDRINVMLAAAAFNFKKWRRELKELLFFLFETLGRIIHTEKMDWDTENVFFRFN